MSDDFSNFCEETTATYISIVELINERNTLIRYKFCIAEYRRLVTELNDTAINKYKLNDKSSTEKKKMLDAMDASMNKYWSKCFP